MNLLEAINCDNIEVVKHILADSTREHEINSVDNHGWTPLHHAVFSNNIDLVKLILNHNKTNVLAECYEGRTVLFLACMNTKQISFDIIELLLRTNGTLVEYVNNELVSPLHEACSAERLDLIQLLVKFGAPVNYTDLDGDTPLHIAARLLNFDIINYFLYGTDCDPTIVNNSNLNPLKCAYLSDRNYSLSAKCIQTLFDFTYDVTTTAHMEFFDDNSECDFMKNVLLYNLDKTFTIINNIYCSPDYNTKATFINETAVCFRGNELYGLKFLMLMHDFYNFNISEEKHLILTNFVTYFFNYITTHNDIEKPLKIIYEMLSYGFEIYELPNDIYLENIKTSKHIKLIQKYILKLLPFVVDFNYIFYKNYSENIQELFMPCITNLDYDIKQLYKSEELERKVPTLQQYSRYIIRRSVFRCCPVKYSSWDCIKQLKKLELSKHLIKYLTYE